MATTTMTATTMMKEQIMENEGEEIATELKRVTKHYSESL